MFRFLPLSSVLLAVVILPAGLRAQERIYGESLPPVAAGDGYVESIETVLERDRIGPPLRMGVNDHVPGRRGQWVVPSVRATYFPHSGKRNVVNKWGDTKMGIGFPELVDLHGVFVSGQGGEGAWAYAIRARGFRAGAEIAVTPWIVELGNRPVWLDIGFDDIDRVIFEARPAETGGTWFGLDDLTFTRQSAGAGRTILDFEDAEFGTVLTESNYAGLEWEHGSGELSNLDAMPPPKVAPNDQVGVHAPEQEVVVSSQLNGTPPVLKNSFQGVRRGDAGSLSFPPDSHGAIGPDHFAEVVNRNFAVYDRNTGAALTNVTLDAFLPGSAGDSRMVFDHHSMRWILINTDFQTRIFLAVSLSDDPLGNWFKTSFVVTIGPDAGTFPDYPTLGVDRRGIYVSAYMFPRGMTTFAIDKSPLVAPAPSLGAVSIFRQSGFEGAIQPAHTYGDPGGAYLLSRISPTAIRVRRIDPPLTAPSLVHVGDVIIPSHAEPPDAPALGSSVLVDTVDHRLMMATYREGSVWTCHTVSVSGRAAIRWYEIDVQTLALNQLGTIADSVLHYFMPSLAINSNGNLAISFSGSSANQYVGAYFSGRHASNAPGEMAAPVLFRAGQAGQNNIDGFGRNRWGDYSYTSVDPVSEASIWTVQEYAHGTNIWGTWVAHLDFDCNENGVDDAEDIFAGTSADCNANVRPDECEPNLDCNNTSVQDICDVASGTSADCNANQVPDECESPSDCNNNGVQDICDLANGSHFDCNFNETLDVCDVQNGTSADCNSNTVPDECEPDDDCNENTVPDICEIAAGISPDCNSNLRPDECDIYECGSVTGVCGGAGRGDCCAPSTFRGCNCAACCVAVCAIDDYCCDVRWDSLCATRAISSLSCACPGGAFEWSFDCNSNDTPDECDISAGASVDCNANGVPDECEPNLDCNGNGIQDICDVASGSSADCNANSVPDTCESSADCNANGFQDICDLATGTSEDCNDNRRPDECDTALGLSGDCNANGVPDECEAQRDCNLNDVQDLCDVASGQSPDCNANGVPDECDIYSCDMPGDVCFGEGDCCQANDSVGCGCERCCAAVCALDPFCCAESWDYICGIVALFVEGCDCGGTAQDYSEDCNGNAVPDECDLASNLSLDCNGNGRPDECDVVADCNDNGVQDICDVAAGASEDCDGNEVPDECDPDCNGNSEPDACDIATDNSADCNRDGVPDECEPFVDCNENGGRDTCDVASGSSLDCDGNGRPDECDQDCNQNGLADVCDVQGWDRTASDDCMEASFACPGRTYIGATNSASSDGAATCGQSTGSRDVWYRYYAPDAGTFRAGLCASGFDTVLSIHTGCPGDPSNEVACNDDFCGFRSFLEVQVEAGGTYWIRISGFSGSIGNFVLALDGPRSEPHCGGASFDCNFNGVLDECEEDCNDNGKLDSCDVQTGDSEDCNANLIPDECEEDCNANGVPDACDIYDCGITSTSCNPFVECCGPVVGEQLGCNCERCCQSVCAQLPSCCQNGWTDLCVQLAHIDPNCNCGEPSQDFGEDCNGNLALDECELSDGRVTDCDANMIPDDCQSDSDSDGTIDACDLCPTDDNKTLPGNCGCGVSDDDTDGDGLADCDDTDDDNDGVSDAQDGQPLVPTVCSDIDDDGCDDCAIGADGFGPLSDFNPANDGPDANGDGRCDAYGIPSMSTWGMVVLALALTIGAKLRRRGGIAQAADLG